MDAKKQEQYSEKSKFIEEHLPSLQSIIEEYQAQGKLLTAKEAEQIREEIRKDMTSEHINVIGDDILEMVVGGAGGSPVPTGSPVISTKNPSEIHQDFRPM